MEISQRGPLDDGQDRGKGCSRSVEHRGCRVIYREQYYRRC